MKTYKISPTTKKSQRLEIGYSTNVDYCDCIVVVLVLGIRGMCIWISGSRAYTAAACQKAGLLVSTKNIFVLATELMMATSIRHL